LAKLESGLSNTKNKVEEGAKVDQYLARLDKMDSDFSAIAKTQNDLRIASSLSTDNIKDIEEQIQVW